MCLVAGWVACSGNQQVAPVIEVLQCGGSNAVTVENKRVIAAEPESSAAVTTSSDDGGIALPSSSGLPLSVIESVGGFRSALTTAVAGVAVVPSAATVIRFAPWLRGNPVTRNAPSESTGATTGGEDEVLDEIVTDDTPAGARSVPATRVEERFESDPSTGDERRTLEESCPTKTSMESCPKFPARSRPVATILFSPSSSVTEARKPPAESSAGLPLTRTLSLSPAWPVISTSRVSSRDPEEGVDNLHEGWQPVDCEVALAVGGAPRGAIRCFAARRMIAAGRHLRAVREGSAVERCCDRRCRVTRRRADEPPD